MKEREEKYYSIKLKTITLKVREDEAKEIMSSSRKCYEIAKAVYKGLDDDQEHFTVFFLNTQNEIKGYKTLFSGGQTSSMVDKAVLFRNVLLFGASAIIVCHNHPSGCLRPSEDDKLITGKIKECAKLFNIKLHDHIILGNNEYYSFADSGLIKAL